MNTNNRRDKRPKITYTALSLVSSVHVGRRYSMRHISGLRLPPARGALRLRGNFVSNRFHHRTKQTEGWLLPCSNVLRGDNARAFYFYFIRSKAGPSTAVLSLGSTHKKFSWLQHFPALTDKTQRANLLQTGILAFVPLPACLRQRKANFHIKY